MADQYLKDTICKYLKMIKEESGYDRCIKSCISCGKWTDYENIALNCTPIKHDLEESIRFINPAIAELEEEGKIRKILNTDGSHYFIVIEEMMSEEMKKKFREIEEMARWEKDHTEYSSKEEATIAALETIIDAAKKEIPA